ncbi:hypothetical protein [Globicatella sanguinis]|uniref:hypothetical protein n=1 Tax=Globicatella sanguinis TaxID=13076 RepID=UPI002542CE90|nr:hypothetical protein [Globicatella sanguinis]MDK7631716.1 hypothetical protein [Globicatella sanguinis]WIK66446.1 hypothetical protein CYJ72_011105 [Globicatella sanguinis]WKT55851.1 hypothetical protein Q3C38_11105 [Globicatella sanguinis]
MDFSNIKHVIEITSEGNTSLIDSYLSEGWQLLHVGTAVADIHNNQLYYSVVYVLGTDDEDLFNKNLKELNDLI